MIARTFVTPLLRVAALRAVEATAQAALAPGALMRRAGEASATLAMRLATERTGHVLVLAGPGNNGGDALVAARCLRERGVDVRVALLDEASRYRGDAEAAWRAWQCDRDAQTIVVKMPAALNSATLVIDGLFGSGFNKGLNKALPQKARDWIASVNAASCPVLALDVPSGMNADTGHVDELAIEADCTITFIAAKPGLYTGDGPDHCGEIVVESLAVGDAIDELVRAPGKYVADIGCLNAPALYAHAKQPRRRNTHKGSFGSVAVVGGATGMAGAALLAARMALHAGAGRVYVRMLASDAPGFDVQQPELMLRKDLDGVKPDAIAAGSGLGNGEAAIAALEEVLDTPCCLVLDADALNLVAQRPALAARIVARSAAGKPCAVLTPHPLEAARLLYTDAAGIQRDRIAAALELARRYGALVVLKGAGTVIADTQGRWTINTTGNPGLATAGTGDVLCGLIAGLCAQGWPPHEAALGGAWIHGMAADDLVANGTGPIGLVASELIPAIRRRLNAL